MNTEEYGKMRESEDHYWWFISRRRLALNLLDESCPESNKILDLGCGTGALLSEIQADKWAAGLDFSSLALEFSHGRGLNYLVNGDAAAVPYKSSVFDAVVSLDTLEHVENDEQAAREIFRVLKPGGVLVLNVPAFKWLWGPHDVALMHYRRYTAGQVRSLLEGAGFEVEKLSYSVFFLFPVVVLIRFLDKFRFGPPKVSLPKVSGGFNQFLLWLMSVEGSMLKSISLPWGSSVVAIARKPRE